MESLNSHVLYPLPTVNLKLKNNLDFVKEVQGHKQVKATIIFMHDALWLKFGKSGVSSW